MLDLRAARSAGLVMCLGMSVSGCLAAAPLIAVGMLAVSGFEVYKTVQLSSGGSVRIEFPGKDGKTNPPQPIPVVRRVAVWPGDEGDVRFAERLEQSGRFESVASPAAVSAILADSKTPADLKQLTEQEQGSAFDSVCRRTRADLVFAARAQGASTNTNTFSLDRANVTYKADLIAYSCTPRRITWRDQIALVIDLGASTNNTAEMNAAGADAWADRILAAMGESTPRKPS